ncbi:UTP--glucose-1-phosphate uridylyltransferase [Patescibacteria group bacterium]|nr:UTP--glucose-1-phosphate uridylyltransferase [Patescibacteria group bacterium]
MKKITKGIIAIAGFGTRFLPATKTIPKEMLPIINKPVIQYIVEEMVEAGITDIILVTSWQKRAVEDYFDRVYAIEEHLEDNGKTDLLTELRRIDTLANFIYVRQKGGHGNGAAILSAQSAVGNEPFLVAFGDDLVKIEPGYPSFSKQLVEDYYQHGTSVLGAQSVTPDQAHKYGIIETDSSGDLVARLIEKPTPQQTKSTLASFGRYLFTPEIFDYLKKTVAGKNGEIWLVDGIAAMLKKYPVRARQIEGGQWYTTGDPVNYFRALLTYSIDQPDLKRVLKEFTKKL